MFQIEGIRSTIQPGYSSNGFTTSLPSFSTGVNSFLEGVIFLFQKIYIPGDNDVGGEGFDPRQEWKVNRFHKYFSVDSPDVETAKFVDFIKVRRRWSYTFILTLSSIASNSQYVCEQNLFR